MFVVTSLIVFLTTAFWPQLSSWVFPNTTLGLYDKAFWENVLVEAHGLVFDIFLIGLVLVWMDSHRQKRESIERNLEGLWDLNTFVDAIYQKKKINMIKRLNASKVYKIDVTDLTLSDVELKDAKFSNSGLYGLKLLKCKIFNLEIQSSKLNSADFSGSKLKNSKILKSYLKNACFAEAILTGVDFQKSDLFRAKFIGTNLENADLRGCNLKRTVFDGANLKQANIRECQNLDCEALAKAECLDYIKADDAVVQVLKELRPEMKVNFGQIENRTLNPFERTTA
ncbi:pentapeptide repeat-containing protein [Vibrio parahaemolyticus]|nr:pentapeptide repeat-containing protein [Vibrio parahaemolyticus]